MLFAIYLFKLMDLEVDVFLEPINRNSRKRLSLLEERFDNSVTPELIENLG